MNNIEVSQNDVTVEFILKYLTEMVALEPSARKARLKIGVKNKAMDKIHLYPPVSISFEGQDEDVLILELIDFDFICKNYLDIVIDKKPN